MNLPPLQYGRLRDVLARRLMREQCVDIITATQRADDELRAEVRANPTFLHSGAEVWPALARMGIRR